MFTTKLFSVVAWREKKDFSVFASVLESLPKELMPAGEKAQAEPTHAAKIVAFDIIIALTILKVKMKINYMRILGNCKKDVCKKSRSYVVGV